MGTDWASVYGGSGGGSDGGGTDWARVYGSKGGGVPVGKSSGGGGSLLGDVGDTITGLPQAAYGVGRAAVQDVASHPCPASA